MIETRWEQAIMIETQTMMRIAIIALGSRGDVQPYIALGVGLQKAGHDIRLIAHENFEGLVKARD